jgi:hypothetical protein
MKTFLATQEYLAGVDHVTILNLNAIHIKPGISLNRNEIHASSIMQNVFMLEVAKGSADIFIVSSNLSDGNLVRAENKQLIVELEQMLKAIENYSGLTTNTLAVVGDKEVLDMRGPIGDFQFRLFCDRHLIENFFDKILDPQATSKIIIKHNDRE